MERLRRLETNGNKDQSKVVRGLRLALDEETRKLEQECKRWQQQIQQEITQNLEAPRQ